MTLEEVKNKLKSEIITEENFNDYRFENYDYYVGQNRGILRALELIGMVGKENKCNKSKQ